jgi:hypothetical protein
MTWVVSVSQAVTVIHRHVQALLANQTAEVHRILQKPAIVNRAISAFLVTVTSQTTNASLPVHKHRILLMTLVAIVKLPVIVDPTHAQVMSASQIVEVQATWPRIAIVKVIVIANQIIVILIILVSHLAYKIRILHMILAAIVRVIAIVLLTIALAIYVYLVVEVRATWLRIAIVKVTVIACLIIVTLIILVNHLASKIRTLHMILTATVRGIVIVPLTIV